MDIPPVAFLVWVDYPKKGLPNFRYSGTKHLAGYWTAERRKELMEFHLSQKIEVQQPLEEEVLLEKYLSRSTHIPCQDGC
ncbi:hypothetical protein SKAU_G00276730 [Synaphobranchus kaupii]|uniref:Uncharacterized protein n=1 Tax=Synaphobranchus kaupii TaxID=118154 RepID=A0A9Q1F1P4_SYNKA|nr:hypothetical protein SKAU_G00276730 [Synaphobranchus kaupii]